MSRSTRSACSLLLLACLLALGTTTRVSAHAEFKSAVPAPESTITTSPERVTIVFTEELEAEGNSITVKDAAGTSVDLGDTQLDKSDADRMTISVGLKPNLPSGVYTVGWKNNGADGHSESGSYTFTTATSGTTTSTPPASLPRTAESGPYPMVWIGLALLALAAGVLLRRSAQR